jgi:hypothetical protein
MRKRYPSLNEEAKASSFVCVYFFVNSFVIVLFHSDPTARVTPVALYYLQLCGSVHSQNFA